MNDYQLIKIEGQAALIEYTVGDQRRRTLVPVGMLDDPSFDPSIGISYGLPWEEIVQLHATPDELANRLRKAGIWTYEDLLAQPKAALGAIQAAYKLDLTSLATAAQTFLDRR